MKVSYEWIIAIGAPHRLHLLSTERPVDHEVALGYRPSFRVIYSDTKCDWLDV